jgi:hypothetical protein
LTTEENQDINISTGGVQKERDEDLEKRRTSKSSDKRSANFFQREISFTGASTHCNISIEGIPSTTKTPPLFIGNAAISLLPHDDPSTKRTKKEKVEVFSLFLI